MTDTPIWRAAVKADCARYVADLFEPLWIAVRGNPLCVGTYCPCGTRLNIGSNINPDETVQRCPVCGEAS
jgi:hypothetical protein